MRRNNLKGVRFGILCVRQIGVGLLLVGKIKVFLSVQICHVFTKFGVATSRSDIKYSNQEILEILIKKYFNKFIYF